MEKKPSIFGKLHKIALVLSFCCLGMSGFFLMLYIIVGNDVRSKADSAGVSISAMLDTVPDARAKMKLYTVLGITWVIFSVISMLIAVYVGRFEKKDYSVIDLKSSSNDSSAE